MCQQLFRLLQLIIMLTPIRQFFKVDYQTWYEWVIAIALGVGALLWAFIVKLVSRWAWHTLMLTNCCIRSLQLCGSPRTQPSSRPVSFLLSMQYSVHISHQPVQPPCLRHTHGV